MNGRKEINVTSMDQIPSVTPIYVLSTTLTESEGTSAATHGPLVRSAATESQLVRLQDIPNDCPGLRFLPLHCKMVHLFCILVNIAQ